MKKHILCFGDSNTHGYCAEPADCADGGSRFNEQERWTCLLGQLLGEDYLVIEEGLSGRTTVFEDPLNAGMSGLSVAEPILMSHEPLDLLVIMLGTNDVKDRFGASPECVARGLERLICKARGICCWGKKGPRILVIAPPHIGEGMLDHPCFGDMGYHAIEKSRHLAPFYRQVCQWQDCAFLDAEGLAQFNASDCMHLTKLGHSQLAQVLAPEIRKLVD